MTEGSFTFWGKPCKKASFSHLLIPYIKEVWAPQARFAWQAQHLEHLYRGPRKSGNDWLHWRRFGLRCRRGIWSPSGSFCVAGAALGAPLAPFALRAGSCSTFIEVRGSLATWLHWAPLRFAWQAQHLGPIRLVLRGRRSTWSPCGSFCVAGAALGAPA